ncbi:MAG: hypothetical protein EBQ96_01265 [Proteobacteria bacterium]|nr:hypothetical protein [Pseudomonadota bacterium]
MSKGPFGDRSKDVSDRILAGIRAPASEPLIDNYVNNRSAEVMAVMTKMVADGEAMAVASFIAADAERFETLTENGHLKALAQLVERMDSTQQFQVLSASESHLYGIPNATVLQNFVGSDDPEVTGIFAGMLRGFNTDQRADVLAVPGAVWWTLSLDRTGMTELLYDVVSSLSQSQRQKVYGSCEKVAMAIDMSAAKELADLFKGCTPPLKSAAGQQLKA